MVAVQANSALVYTEVTKHPGNPKLRRRHWPQLNEGKFTLVSQVSEVDGQRCNSHIKRDGANLGGLRFKSI